MLHFITSGTLTAKSKLPGCTGPARGTPGTLLTRKIDLPRSPLRQARPAPTTHDDHLRLIRQIREHHCVPYDGTLDDGLITMVTRLNVP